MLFHSNQVKIVERAVSAEIYQRTNSKLEPIIRKIYASRGLTEDQTDHSLQNLIHPSAIKGIDQACQVLLDSIQNQEKICIVGDYDVDGATSSALLIDGLTQLGAKVIYSIPNRMKDGYGLSEGIIEKIVAKDKEVKLIITVDNGISSIKGVELAKKKAIKIIITDHHLAGKKLPDADGFVNPNLETNHPLKNLAGVGVSFYFLAAIVERLKKNNQSTQGIKIKDYLDLVALGTVADCVPLDFNNRILVLNGIECLKKNPRIGIKAMIDQISQISLKTLSSNDISFYLAPLLNAAGRVIDMSIGLECLLTKEANQAKEFANQLKNINQERKSIQNEMKDSADQLLKKIDLKNKFSAHCFYHPDWHEGIVGILASKLKEQLLKPVVVFAQSDQKNILKGSSRSIQSVNIKDVLEEIALNHPKLMLSFGGHAMAAGIQIEVRHLAQFNQAFQQQIESLMGENQTNDAIEIDSDGELNEQELKYDLAKKIEQAACWGSRLEFPLFHGSFFLIEKEIFASQHIKLKLAINQQSKIYYPAVCFFQADKFDSIGEVGEKLTLCYQTSISKYNNSLQLIIRYIIKDD